jgi:hypothetical protein
MDKVTLYDTLDVLSDFIVDKEKYWEDRAGVIVRSLSDGVTVQVLAALGLRRKADELEITKVKAALKKEHEANWSTEVPAYLNSLSEDERRAELAEYCRQRFLRAEQEGYDETDAQRALDKLRAAGVNVPEGVI